jgi:subtilisin
LGENERRRCKRIASHQNLSILKGISFVQGVDSYEDKLGHGTHCAGIIAAQNNHTGMIGIAPAVDLLAVKVLADSGKGTLAWVIAGLCWALREGANVVSMSIGTMHAPLQAYKIAVEKLNDNNISVVCAAGNTFGTNEYRFVNAPANTTGVIAVGAVDASGQIVHFSSQGSEGNPITIVAPGVEISSTFLGNQYRTYSGTSMACPHVAAAVALLKSLHPELIPAEIKSRLMSTAQSLGETEAYGAGLLDCAAFVG